VPKDAPDNYAKHDRSSGEDQKVAHRGVLPFDIQCQKGAPRSLSRRSQLEKPAGIRIKTAPVWGKNWGRHSPRAKVGLAGTPMRLIAVSSNSCCSSGRHPVDDADNRVGCGERDYHTNDNLISVEVCLPIAHGPVIPGAWAAGVECRGIGPHNGQ
jgi:hypothetical protein